jgi:CheY-like chemotaxis protein
MSALPPPGRAGHILLIEDDRAIRDTLARILAEEGYSVTSKQDGLDGLTYLRASRPLPSLILLDLMMPVMDGWQFCAEKACDPTLSPIPVVVVSADRNMDQGRAEGLAVLCMQKPLDLDELLEVIARFCAKE